MSIATLNPEADTYVSEAAPTSNRSADLYIALGSYSVGTAYRAWLRFNLASIPAGSTINSATLSMHNYYEDHVFTYPAADYTFDCARSTDITWSEASITWNNAPNGTVGSVLDSYTNAALNAFGYFMTFDVTSGVSAALASGKVSFRIKPNDETLSNLVDYFDDYNYGGTSYSNLEVDYTAPASTNTNFFVMF